MKNVEKLTVIVPSFNRQKLALNTLNNWSKLNINVHLVDGSEKPIESSRLSHLSKNIKYHHVKIISEIDRIKNILNLINTKYCILGADDDLLLPNALSKCVNFLEKNNDFSSCFGQVLSFMHHSNQNKFYENKLNLKNFTLQSENKEKRLRKYALKPVPFCILSVMRTNIFKKLFDITNPTQISFYANLELRASILVPYFGKSMAISNLILLRNKDNAPITNRNRSNTSLFKFLLYNNKRKERDLFISSLIKLLDKEEQEGEKIIKKTLFYHLFFSIYRILTIKIFNIIIYNINFLHMLKKRKKIKSLVSLEDLQSFCEKKQIQLDEEDLNFIKEKFNNKTTIK